MITLQKSERWLNKMFGLILRQTNVNCFDNRSERNMYCRKRGFTLIEIIIVIVILAIAAMTALPMLSSASSVQIRSAANLIAADLEYAKSMAISRGQNYSIVFNESGNSYQIEDQDGTVIKHPVTKYDFVMNFANDRRLGRVDITNVNFDGTSIVEFDCLGSPVDLDNAGTITLNADGSTATISVEPVTGYISISL
jgi:prepilin-type N-terminal cleavage/methylation domain-containing protein